MPIALEFELHVAHLTARLPILTVIGAEMQLPRVTQPKGQSERHLVRIVLDVKWERVAAILVAIALGQALAIAATVFVCRRVILHGHDSFFPIARLLNAAVNRAPGRSVDTGVELAARMEAVDDGRVDEDVRGMGMRYGTRRWDEGVYEVDFGGDVKGDFPEGWYR
jgi:hypothetical protein